MSIQAHRCNQVGCNGFILFDNADFDYKAAVNKDYTLDRPTCDTCGKEFMVVVSHVLIEFDEEKHELVDELHECGYQEFEKARKPSNQP